MIRTLVAHDGALVRGALAFVLGAEADIEVVAQVGRFEDVADAVGRCHPDVVVLDVNLMPADQLLGGESLHKLHSAGPMLILAEARQSRVLGSVMAGSIPGVSFLAKNGPPERLVSAVRQIAMGEPVLDPELVVSALRTVSPLTARETQVLAVAAEGLPVKEIAARLGLAPGTVRNHLSRVLGKAGARTRMEAVCKAQRAGWI